jgi:hypothetical protein
MPRRRRFRPCVPGKREPNGRLSRAKPDQLERCAQEELAVKLVAFFGKLPQNPIRQPHLLCDCRRPCTCGEVYGRLDRHLSLPLPWYTSRQAESSLAMNFTIEFFRTRPSDEAHAILDRISIGADNLDAATVKAKSLFDTLDMPQKPDGLRILDQVKRELFVWKPDDHNA